jgi:hypothetical protein
VLLFVDKLCEPAMLQDVWAQWAAWQAQRWLKSADVARPHHHARLVLHEELGLVAVRAARLAADVETRCFDYRG